MFALPFFVLQVLRSRLRRRACCRPVARHTPITSLILPILQSFSLTPQRVCVGTGTGGAVAARLAIARAQRQLAEEANVHLHIRNFSVINSVGAVSLRATLNCDAFASEHSGESHFDRSSFVGLAVTFAWIRTLYTSTFACVPSNHVVASLLLSLWSQWRPPRESICCGKLTLPVLNPTPCPLLLQWCLCAWLRNLRCDTSRAAGGTPLAATHLSTWRSENASTQFSNPICRSIRLPDTFLSMALCFQLHGFLLQGPWLVWLHNHT